MSPFVILAAVALILAAVAALRAGYLLLDGDGTPAMLSALAGMVAVIAAWGLLKLAGMP